MWRALLGRKLALVAGVAAVTAVVSYYRAGPAPPEGYETLPFGDGLSEGVKENVAAWLRTAHGFPVDGGYLHLTRTDDAPLAYGAAVVGWFSAPPDDRTPNEDIFSVRLRLSGSGVPVATTPPVNITRTPDGDERVLHADGRRLLYSIRVGGEAHAAVVLDFGHSWLPPEAPLSTRMVAHLGAKAQFGTGRGPRRSDIVLERPSEWLHGRLTPGGVRLVAEDLELVADLVNHKLDPPDRARLLEGAPPQQEPLALLADALRKNDVVGPARVLAIESALFRLTDWLRRQSHRLFPTAADRAPVTARFQPPIGQPAWPPRDIEVPERAPGEGHWRVPELYLDGPAGGTHAPVRQTWLRVDPERPYSRVHLFAFDAGRLGLHFVAGTRHPRSPTGVRGEGRVHTEHRDQLLAAFNGGFKVEHGHFGAVERGRTLVEPRKGLATLVHDTEGRVGLGLWDAERLHPPWVGLRQNLPPLVADGAVNPSRSSSWGEVVSELDAAQTPRSGLGVTRAGMLIYAWSEATSAEHLGEALRRAGVRFAMHLDMNPGHAGVELYRPDEGGSLAARKGVPSMDFRGRRWLQTDARDFFYLRRLDGPPPAMVAVGGDRARGEGRWRTVPADGPARLAVSYLTAARIGGAHQARLVRLDADRLRAHVVPGLAEPQPVTGLPTAELSLPAPPVAWLGTGLRRKGTPYGLVAGRRTWRAPYRDSMTFAVDDAGRAVMGRWGERGLDDAQLWDEVVQGATLLEDGEVTAPAAPAAGLPLAGLGQTPAGVLVYATVPDGDARALARALQIAGATEALALADQPTAETGVARFFILRGGRLFARDDPRAMPRPADLAPGAGTGLVFTPRPGAPRARTLNTFRPSKKWLDVR